MPRIIILSLAEAEDEVLEKIMDVIEHSDMTEVEKKKTDRVIQIGNLQIDFAQYVVRKEEREICLTNTEFRLLYFWHFIKAW